MIERIPEETLLAAERSFRFSICAMLNSLVAQTMMQKSLTMADLARRIGKDEPWLLKKLGAPDDLTLDNMSDIAVTCGAMPVFSLGTVDWEPIPTPQPPIGE